jgi:glycine amidinotransferase
VALRFDQIGFQQSLPSEGKLRLPRRKICNGLRKDFALILGNEIIETAPQVRGRFFENQFVKPIFTKYFEEGARWTLMPRPMMTDNSFDASYALGAPNGPTEFIDNPRPSVYDVGREIMLDGAQCLRLGRDLFVNVANANHELGYKWLERHLAGRVRVHRMDKLADNHIDSVLIALRPGLLLLRTPQVADSLPDPLRSWDKIFAPEPRENNFPRYADDDLVLTSPYIDLNVLSIDPETVMANEACPELLRLLEKVGFTVVPVRHRHRRLFGGGLHCFTLDTVRDQSEPEDYFS